MKPLQATVTLTEFCSLNAFDNAAQLLLVQNIWKYLFIMCCALYAPMRVLHLADIKTAGMDKFYYYVLQVDMMLLLYLRQTEVLAEDLLTNNIKLVFDSTTDAASIECKDDDKEISDEKDKKEKDHNDDDEENKDDKEEENDASQDDLSIESTGNKWERATRLDTVTRMWIKRRCNLMNDYSLIGYLLSPNPIIIAHANGNKTFQIEEVSITVMCFSLLCIQFASDNYLTYIYITTRLLNV